MLKPSSSALRPLPVRCAGILLLAGIFLPHGTLPARASQGVPDQIDVSKFPAAMVENVVVPVPSEIFAVLDKLGEPNWRAEIRRVTSRPLGTREDIALLLGTVIADGFIAVQAEDPEQVKDIGREVLRLSTALGVSDSVKSTSNAIIDGADAKDWAKVRKALDKALQEVRAAMDELKDEQLAQLVSLGGWIRGTEVLTSIVGKSFSEDGAELLRQPGLLEYFQNRLSGMPPRFQENYLVGEVRIALAEIRPIVDVEDGRTISAQSVGKVHTLTAKLVEAIAQPKPDGAPTP